MISDAGEHTGEPDAGIDGVEFDGEDGRIQPASTQQSHPARRGTLIKIVGLPLLSSSGWH
jgi:hypothetical protein